MGRRFAIALAVVAVLTVPGSVRTAPAPPLELTKITSPASVLVGGRITYTITARPNVSGFTINTLRIRDELPTRVRFVSISPGSFSCSRAGNVVTCTLATLPAARSFSIAVDAAEAGVAENTATATAILPNPDTSTTITANASVQTRINAPTADLVVRKTGPAQVSVGENVSYSIRVTNNGPQPAAGVSVRDDLPNGPDVVSVGTGCTRNGGIVTCSAGTLAVNASQTFAIVVRPRAPGTIVNQATATSDTNDPNAGNNTDTVRTLVLSADLVAEKAAPARVDVGENLTYTLAVRNAGPNPAENVLLRDDLPNGVNVVTLDPRCNRAGGLITCNLGTIADGARVPVTLVVRPTAAGTITNTARVSSGTFDPNDGNNSASAQTVVHSADVSVSKIAPVRVTVGDQIEYRLRVRNAGPSPAAGVVLVDRLPQGVDLVSRGGCTATGLQIKCSLGTLAKGASRERRIVVRAREEGVRVNRAEVTSTTFDPRRGNNEDSASTTVEGKTEEPAKKADVSLDKDAPASVQAGKTVRYAIAVRNAGPDAAAAVVLRDDLPGGVTVAKLDSRCRRENRLVTCTLGTLAARAETTLAVTVRTGSAGRLVNIAEATSTTSDPDTGNNRDETTTEVKARPEVDVSIVKRAPGRARVGETFRYELRIRNAGPSAAEDVVARDELPQALRLVTAGSPCTASGRTVTCRLGTLKAGAKRTVALRVVATAPGRVTNAATVTTSVDDSKKSNDSDRVSTRVTKAPGPLLTLDPPLGTPGFATQAIGTGFPANAGVELQWRPGLGVPVRVRADRNGVFRVHVLVIPHDRLGRRKLVARPRRSGATFAPVSAKFLVVPATVQPSAFVVRG